MVQMSLGRMAADKGILVLNINLVKLGTRKLLTFLFVAMVKISIIAMVIETVAATNSYFPNLCGQY